MSGALRGTLSRLAGESLKSDEELRLMARAAWRKGGVIVLFPDQVLSWEERALLESAARKLYGERLKPPAGQQR